jgi:catechol-2,3-dioxygenase
MDTTVPVAAPQGYGPSGHVPRIGRLAHVGIYVENLDTCLAFYRDVLGLQVTNTEPGMGLAFLSSRPEDEDHELLLAAGRDVPIGTSMLQQISWRCDSIDDVIAWHYKLREHGVAVDMEVSHGIALGIYFLDPEGNRNEVYWATGLKAKQAYLASVDLEAPVEEILAAVRANVEEYGLTGYVEPGFLERQQIGS